MISRERMITYETGDLVYLTEHYSVRSGGRTEAAQSVLRRWRVVNRRQPDVLQ